MSEDSKPHSELVARVRSGLGGDFPFDASETVWKDASEALDSLVEQYEEMREELAEGLAAAVELERLKEQLQSAQDDRNEYIDIAERLDAEKRGLLEQYGFVSGEYEDAKSELFDVCAERDGLKEQLQAAEDHIAGLCKELDARAPGWEKGQMWYARGSNPARES